MLNMMVMCVDVNPVVVSICDCTNHMSEGGQKDSTYMAEMFQEMVNEFDPKDRHTDVFVFDGAANAQKAAQILFQTFPRAYCFHDGEYVLYFFFSDLSRLKHIQVRDFEFFILLCYYANIFSVPCFESLQIVQCIWIRCKPWDPCTIHDLGISNEQW